MSDRMNNLLRRQESLNDLVDMRTQEEIEATSALAIKKKDGKGKSGRSGIFSAVANDMFFSHNGAKRPSILSITDPSDGHPMQEHTPDFNWFRSLTWNNPTWTLYWPDLII